MPTIRLKAREMNSNNFSYRERNVLLAVPFLDRGKYAPKYAPKNKRRKRRRRGESRPQFKRKAGNLNMQHHIELVITRNGRPVPIKMPILDVQYDAYQKPVSVILGSPRVSKEVWYYDACLFEELEVVDLYPEEDAYAVQIALEAVTDEEMPDINLDAA
jgi:hypothetical protein